MNKCALGDSLLLEASYLNGYKLPIVLTQLKRIDLN